MLQADLADSSFSACADAVRRILAARGVDAQDGTRAWSYGAYRFVSTNGGTLQAWFTGQLVMRLPLPGSSEATMWNPGDWVSGIDALDQEIGVSTR